MTQQQQQQQQQQQSQKPLLSDILSKLPQAQIFSSLIRDVDSAVSLLSTDISTTSSSSNNNDNNDDNSQQQQQQQQYERIIVFAPTNAALHALPQKPWRSSRDEEKFGAQAYEGEAGAQRASSNLRQFVQRQIVQLRQEWREGEKVKTVGGKQVWWERGGNGGGGGGRILQPGNIKVDSEEHAENGDVWIVQGVLGEG